MEKIMPAIIRKVPIRFNDQKLTTIVEISGIKNDYHGMPAVWVNVKDKKTGKVLGSSKINLSILGYLPD